MRLLPLLSGGLAAAVVAAAVALPAEGATTSVSVKDNVFAPTSKTVKRGDTVRFVWRGRAPHNVKAVAGPSRFGSSTMTDGSYTKKLRRRGTYTIICTVHGGDVQKMKLVVR